MLYEQMAECTLEGSGFIKTYRKLFSDSGVLRVARENYAYTALKGKTAFLYVNVNGMDVCFKIELLRGAKLCCAAVNTD